MACIFFTPFLKSNSLFSRRLIQKILSLCMVSIQEQFLIKSGLWWRVYSICFFSVSFLLNFKMQQITLCYNLLSNFLNNLDCRLWIDSPSFFIAHIPHESCWAKWGLQDNICGRKRCFAITFWPHFEAVILELKCWYSNTKAFSIVIR